MRRTTWGLSALALAGCAAQSVRYVRVTPPSAQAISLLGDTLWNLPVDPQRGPALVRQLQEARTDSANRPTHVNTQLQLARRTEAMGRLREAIGLYTSILELSPLDERVYRRRGELLIRIRELDLAVQDLRTATRLTLQSPNPNQAEFDILPGGQGIVQSTLLYNTFFHLGMALYFRGDFRGARETYREAVRRASNADELAQTVFWLFCATRRLGLREEARQIVLDVAPGMPVVLAEPEYQLIRAYRGEITQDSLPVDGTEAITTADEAMYAYGIGFALLMLDRTEEASLLFGRVRAISDWSSYAYLAAEAELARLQAIRRAPRS